MLKKFVSILMLYSALAIVMGHNFIGHNHDFEHNEVSHHHNNEHHHDHGHHHDNEEEKDEESEDWWALFLSSIQHGTEGFTYLTGHGLVDIFLIQANHFNDFQSTYFIFNQEVVEVRQNAPPYLSKNYSSKKFLPFGLRAPPFFIV